jgi:hypothetical protein
MKQPILAILLALVVGVVAAFFQPAQPYQVPTSEKNIFAHRSDVTAAFDSGLDNDDIEMDSNISPARKCGFCIG